MAYSPDYRTYAPAGTANAAVLDAGLRAYMLRVYNWMASGLLLTGVVAYGVANTSFINVLYPVVETPNGLARTQGPLAIVAMLAPLAFVLVLSFGVNRLSKTSVQAIFWAFCATMGLSLTSIFLVYSHQSIVTTFFVTSATFAAMSIVGYTTKRDLTSMGGFLIMGLFGVIIASVINMFMHSSQMQMVISIVGVLVFVGLTAYDTQRIKLTYTQYAYAEGMDGAGKRSVYDALSLYLNFINLFMLMLQLTGGRRQ